ncbi:OPT superfamily oligopeptide transporter [Tricholoma matsutake]|nr:OPT superfamily oligopeptide transporter [Tricholoma matsutake 945]
MKVLNTSYTSKQSQTTILGFFIPSSESTLGNVLCYQLLIKIIVASVGAYSAFATDVMAVQRLFYDQTYNDSYAKLWPANLVTCALLNTLHGQRNRGGLSHEKFFLYALLASSTWYLLPGYLFKPLSFFSWVCWIAPENIPVACVGSPLATPWWAEANIAAGFVLFFLHQYMGEYVYAMSPPCHFESLCLIGYARISSRVTYNNTGQIYTVSKILNPDSTFNEEMYKNYSPLPISATFAVSYGLSFAVMAATLTHIPQARRSMQEQPDIHARLMARYPQVPEWWYLIMFAFVSITVWYTKVNYSYDIKVKLPVHYFVFTLHSFYVIPTNLNVINELIIGCALPGRPIAMMLFKTWGYIAMSQGTTELAVQAWMFTNVPDICSSNQPGGGAASIIDRNSKPPFFFLISGACPLVAYLLSLKFPNSWLRYIKLVKVPNPLSKFFQCIVHTAAVNYVLRAMVGFIFQYIIRKRHFSWWAKYNYLSAALDAGVAVSAVSYSSFCNTLQMGLSIGLNTIQVWWGNTVPFATADAKGTPMRQLQVPKGQSFGPRTWA